MNQQELQLKQQQIQKMLSTMNINSNDLIKIKKTLWINNLNHIFYNNVMEIIDEVIYSYMR